MHETANIYAFYDMPHLLKGIINNLERNDYKIECEIISAVPKLSAKHIHPGLFDKMNVKRTAQGFSRSVYAGTSEHDVNEGSTRQATANFVLKINLMFDMFNSRSLFDKNSDKRALNMKRDGVHYLLTSRLQQDPLENIFSLIRMRYGYGRTPSAKEFR
ncbi:hypothetical protein PR048_023490 [Dryococelus australis]|uniref:Transposase n=1 Tax=Dryococelus australis TaxID=614101 RepID=A0ABQ9GUB4_9NEOP|nr:hypothetical protein PR048_023490 [Dryococelus australis]